MSSGERLPLAEGERLARELCDLWAPAVERVVIAGSIRRQQPTVGDIELVCVPRYHTLPDLFGEGGSEHNLLDGLVREWLADGRLAHRLDTRGHPANGERAKRLRYQGVALDVFGVLPPAEWGVILVIRTGPADYSKALVTPRSQGGHLPDWLQVQGGALHRRDDGTLLPTPEEADFYAALGLPFVTPSQRGAVPA